MSVFGKELASQTSYPSVSYRERNERDIPNMRARCKSNSSSHTRSSPTEIDRMYLKFPSHIRSRINKSVLLDILVGSSETWNWECFQYRFTGFLSSAPILLLSWMYNSRPMDVDQENRRGREDIQQYA